MTSPSQHAGFLISLKPADSDVEKCSIMLRDEDSQGGPRPKFRGLRGLRRRRAHAASVSRVMAVMHLAAKGLVR